MPAPTAQATKATRAAAATAPFPRSAADFIPDEYKLKCCICRKLFRGGGHNPGGFSWTPSGTAPRNWAPGPARTLYPARSPHSVDARSSSSPSDPPTAFEHPLSLLYVAVGPTHCIR